jgi:hypothetical protein
MYNDTYVKGAYLDLTPSKPFAKDDTSRKMQMEMNGQWMKNKNLPLMKPNATWTWIDYNLEFKSMVVPVPKGRLTSKNVLILDTPQKLQLMQEHFPQWLIDNHCSLHALPLTAYDVLKDMEQPMIHESVEAPNGEGIMLEYSTPSERLEQIRKFEMEGGLITHAHNEPCPMMGDDEVSDPENLEKIRNLMNEFKDSDTK